METCYYFNINLMFLSHGRIRLSWKDVREPEKNVFAADYRLVCYFINIHNSPGRFFSTPILQMRRPRLRKVRSLVRFS